MKLQPFVDKINASLAYKEFMQKYNDAFLVAGFFIMDLELGQNMHQIDYYMPSQKKFAAFTLDENVNIQILDAMFDKVPEKLDAQTDIDLDALPGILEDEMKNRNITEEIKKIIAVLQTVHGKKVWNVNCVLSGMEILKVHVEDASQTILKMEKSSFTDLVKKIPSQQLQLNPNHEESTDVIDQIKKLNQLETQIKKEKNNLKKQLKKQPIKKELVKGKRSKGR